MGIKRILQNYKTGRTEVAELPLPAAKRGHLLIRTRMTLISSGTERMAVQASKKSLLNQALERPEKIKKAFDQMRTTGVLATVDAIRQRSDLMQSLGYCNVGEVIELGDGVDGFAIGDRVVSNGPHAEVVCVPQNLCARIPEGVADDEAVFTVLGAIALQGVRLLEPTLGECMVVSGLGTIGLLGVQLLRANGCRVLAIDFNAERLAVAEKLGAETFLLGNGADPIVAGQEFSRGRGVDGVLITAATDSNEPLHQAAKMCRKRGRIVLTGVIGPEISRADFFEKELTFQVSCSYGPGRYDPIYEEQGQDYPFPFVRWTEQRNFEAFLDLLAEKKIQAANLLSHRFPIDQAQEAYGLIGGGAAASLGIAITYPAQCPLSLEASRRLRMKDLPARIEQRDPREPVIAFIGAGNYGANVLLPAFKKTGARLKTVADRGGFASWLAARKNEAEIASTDIEFAMNDGECNTVVIATRHDTHASLVCKALRAGKHVFVEKPLAIREEQIKEIEACLLELETKGPTPLLMVGFNRRFAPHVVKMRELLGTNRAPLSMVMTVNAGAIPKSHWAQDPAAGGGRIIGEGCHFVDLMRFLAGSPIKSVHACAIGSDPVNGVTSDKVSVLIEFEDGSTGALNYLANGHGSYPKESLEVFSGGKVFRIDNFLSLRGYGQDGFSSLKLWRQDKGQAACAAAFAEAIRKGAPSPIPFAELVEVARATFEIADQIK